MTEEVILEAPKRDFYLKLNAESDMPTVLSDTSNKLATSAYVMLRVLSRCTALVFM